MSLLQHGAAIPSGASAYDIDNSLKFEPDNSEYIHRTPSSAGNRKTWTLSFWIKRTELADGSNTMRVFEAWTGSTGTSALFTATDNFILDLSLYSSTVSNVDFVRGNQVNTMTSIGNNQFSYNFSSFLLFPIIYYNFSIFV